MPFFTEPPPAAFVLLLVINFEPCAACLGAADPFLSPFFPLGVSNPIVYCFDQIYYFIRLRNTHTSFLIYWSEKISATLKGCTYTIFTKLYTIAYAASSASN